MALRPPSDDQRASGLPTQATEALRRLAVPPRALPELVDARIRAAIDGHASFRRRRSPTGPFAGLALGWTARWAVAAAVAIVAGATLGWSGVGPWSRRPGSATPAQPSLHARTEGPRVRPTIVDAMLAARLADEARRDAPTAGTPTRLDDALLARLDADLDGAITRSDARILAERAVRQGAGEGSS